ncbi:MAG: SRPBCC family protein [Solirubrobacterales bacterium]
MTRIHHEVLIDAEPAEVWSALRDWGALHKRLVPGFVTDTQLDGEDRVVTFANGAVMREVLLDSDEDARRLVWTIVDGPYAHHNGCAQVFDAGTKRSRFVWTAYVLPEESAAPTSAAMAQGIEVVKQTLEAASDSGH